jgi:hypothetical protein
MQWLTSIIPVTQEAEMGKKVGEIPFEPTTGCGSTCLSF